MKLFTTAIIVLIVMFCSISSVFAQDVNQVIKKADEMYSQIKSVNDFDALIKYLKDAEWNNKGNWDITWRVGRALSEKAVISFLSFMNENMKNRKIKEVDDILDSDKSLEKNQENTLLELGKEARYYMEKAKALNSSRVETFYYEALSISMYGLGKSIVSALLEGISGKYESALKSALKIDKSYMEGGALRLFGRYYYVLPWPKRDIEESIKYLQEAVQSCSNNVLNNLYLGDVLWRDGKKDEAKNYWTKASQITSTTTIERIILINLKNMLSKRLSLN
jgi:hypothetical protein